MNININVIKPQNNLLVVLIANTLEMSHLASTYFCMSLTLVMWLLLQLLYLELVFMFL
jgi:hypothetical protein